MPDAPPDPAHAGAHDLRCVCGEKLVDAFEPPEVAVGDHRFPFRRTTDHLICPVCRRSYRVTELGPDEVPSPDDTP